MTDAEKSTKFLNYAGLEHLIEVLKSHGVAGGLGLSQENFTSALKAKYDALVAVSSVEDMEALFTRVSSLEALVEADSDKAINKFNEIVAFLAGIEQGGDGLSKTLSDIAAQIAEAKKAGTDAQSALDTYKAANDEAVAAKVSTSDFNTFKTSNTGAIADAKKAGTDAASALDAYKTANDTAVAAAKKAGTDAASALETYKTSNDTAVAAKVAKSDFETYQGTVTAALAGKVDTTDLVAITNAEIDAIVNPA